jgi:hypothetical protein
MDAPPDLDLCPFTLAEQLRQKIVSGDRAGDLAERDHPTEGRWTVELPRTSRAERTRAVGVSVTWGDERLGCSQTTSPS